MHYSTDDLVRLAKRDNNSVRPYLYVNPIQGKHIPTNPEDTMMMCHTLAMMVNKTYPSDRLFVIGFAETATGIAAGVCHYLDNALFFQNTTREQKGQEGYLYFTESHSHATDQMLRTAGVEKCIKCVDRVVFVDDEVTTGNTIKKLASLLQEKYGDRRIKYSIVSILNSMSKERLAQFRNDGIDCMFLSDLPFEYKKESIMGISYERERDTVSKSEQPISFERLEFDTNANTRCAIAFEDYERENNRFAYTVKRRIRNEHHRDLLVLGTEECMYPAIILGEQLKRDGIADTVKVHATTRSPIIASGAEGYPLGHRYRIRSIYDKTRDTYVYNLKKYDKVIVVTDAAEITEGLNDLLSALRSVGNHNIMVVRWHYL